MVRNFTLAGTAIVALTFTSGGAFADSISPETFDAVLGAGESVTIEKTVVVSAGDPTSARLDTHFLFDTSGSMGGRIGAAQTAAADILAGLDAFGDAAGAVGVYSEAASLTNPPPGNVLNLDVNTDTSVGGAVDTAIQAVTLGNPDGGGDGLENGNTAIERVSNNATWRTGSSRFLFVFGDIGFKDETDTTDTGTGAPLEAITSDADVIAALGANDVQLFGLGTTGSFATSITELGGTFFETGTDPDVIVSTITAGIGGSFAEYTNVTVSDLGNGLPGVSVSTVCTSAAVGGVCAGSDAVGDYDRSEERTFTFDVTFTNVGLAPGGSTTFETFALVDGRSVAIEMDTISAPIPLPAAAWLLMGGLGGLAALRRRKA